MICPPIASDNRELDKALTSSSSLLICSSQKAPYLYHTKAIQARGLNQCIDDIIKAIILVKWSLRRI